LHQSVTFQGRIDPVFFPVNHLGLILQSEMHEKELSGEIISPMQSKATLLIYRDERYKYE